MGRPRLYKKDVDVSMKLEEGLYRKLQDIAALETLHWGRRVAAVELMRKAIAFVYEDNELLRECFKRSRSPVRNRKK